MKTGLAFVVVAVVFVSSAHSQIPFSQTDETSFTLGLQSFKQGDYSTSYLYFKQVMDDSLNQRSEEAFYYGARSLFNLRRYSESSAAIDTFLVRFPSDERRYEMMYLLGADYYELGKYPSAASRFIVASDSAFDPTVRDRAVASLRSLIDTNIGFDEVEAAFEQCKTRLSASTVALAFARRAYDSDRLSDAAKMLHEFSARYPQPGTGTTEITRWLARIVDDSLRNNAQVRIGVLLPLEYGSGVGDKLLLGIQLALDGYNETAQTKIGMTVRNYAGNIVTLSSSMRALAKDPNVKAVIGPVFSGEVSQVVSLAGSAGLPTITPTATQVGLTAEGSYVFQANPNYMTRADAIADFAVDVLHLKRFAILAPSDSYGKTIAGYFATRLNSKGISVISSAEYESGSTDLVDQIGKIKTAAALAGEPYVDFTKLTKPQQAKLAEFGIPSAYVDSVANSKGTLDAYDLLGSNPVHIADSLGIPITMRTTLDQFEALRSLDAVFIPLTSSKDIGVIGAQLAYYNVKTQILGTDDWYDVNQLSNNDLYVDGIIFCSDTYFNTVSPAFTAASDSLSQISDMELDRTVAYGFDTASLILSAIKSGGTNRSDIYNALRAEAYPGLHSMISFAKDNSNHYLYILQFKKGNIVDLGEVNPN
ncbi:MAG TPA: penicillin-binding protein activator [Candidatus Kryptonia bacterium]